MDLLQAVLVSLTNECTDCSAHGSLHVISSCIAVHGSLMMLLRNWQRDRLLESHE